MADWLVLIERELLLFAGVFLLIGNLDEFSVDCAWIWLRLTGRARTPAIDRDRCRRRALAGRAALFIPTWHEAGVIAVTLRHVLRAWPQSDLRVYVGCYANDAGTVRAAMAGSGGDPRVRIVIRDRPGPTTKADCLNGLYAAMERDERRAGQSFRMVVLHDAEDMVDPAALALLDAAIGHGAGRNAFVQLPVLPQPQPRSRWTGSHYCEEFAEAHGRTMIVRSAVGAGLPAAGVGCAFARDALRGLVSTGAEGPFAPDCLTEDYELGLRLAARGAASAFLRVRALDGTLVATRAFFPSRLSAAVRQKARWVHGIAFQGWDRLGWGGSPAESWMRLRDRRGPLSALVLLCAYALLLVEALLWLLPATGAMPALREGSVPAWLIVANLIGFVWRAGWRFAFTAREYGAWEGLRAVLRLPFANIIAILAGRRALFAYIRSLCGGRVRWDKTEHHLHPGAVDGARRWV